jgi:manganese/zinc/iron transport system substrate-binding protein
MRATRKLVALPLVLCLFLVGCTSSASNATNTNKKKTKVVATTGMIADLVRQIGGDTIDVEQLMNSGVDPHLYKPNTDDVRAISSADIVFYNGFKLEGRMGDLLGRNSSKKLTHIAVAETIDKESAMGDPEHETADPHVWMDVQLWTHVTNSIERQLIQKLPEHENLFASNAKSLRLRLEKLDQLGQQMLGSIPSEQRILITSHDAFRYFGKRYGLQVEGIQGISTSSEAGLHHIRELVDLLVSKKVRAVFVESSVAQKSIQALIEGAAQQNAMVEVGGQLYSDAMGPAGSGADTYEGMMLHNFRVIAKALGGKISEGATSNTEPKSQP